MRQSQELEDALQEILGTYCAHILSDYLVFIAMPTQVRDSDGNESSGAEARGAVLSQEAWVKLRQGAYALYGACSSTEVSISPANLPVSSSNFL